MRWGGGREIKAIRLRSWQGSFRQAMSVTITRRLGGRGEGRTGVKGAGRGVGEEGGGVTVGEVAPPCKKKI